MRIRSYQEMLNEYKELDSDDKAQRDEELSKNSYSIIIEGDFLEFDNLDKWIQENLDKTKISDLFYGKTGYDFGFLELFFNEKSYEPRLLLIITNIYTTYPIGCINRTNGYNEFIDYNSNNKNAIAFKLDK